MSKILIFVTTWVLSSSKCTKTSFQLQAQNAPKPAFSHGSAGELTTPRRRSGLGRGTPSPHPPRRFWRFDLCIYGASLHTWFLPSFCKSWIRPCKPRCICMLMLATDYTQDQYSYGSRNAQHKLYLQVLTRSIAIANRSRIYIT